MNKKEQLISQINQEANKLKSNNYFGIIDEREHRVNAFVEKIKEIDFDDNELDIMLADKNLIKNLANQEPNWRLLIAGYENQTENDIGFYIKEQTKKKVSHKRMDEEM